MKLDIVKDVKEAVHDMSENPLLRTALVLEGAALLGDVVGRVLHMPGLMSASKIGEIAGIGLGYSACVHQLETEDRRPLPS